MGTGKPVARTSNGSSSGAPRARKGEPSRLERGADGVVVTLQTLDFLLERVPQLVEKTKQAIKAVGEFRDFVRTKKQNP